jgi:hypothetical protein
MYLARYKRSSLFGRRVSGEEKKGFVTVDSWFLDKVCGTAEKQMKWSVEE